MVFIAAITFLAQWHPLIAPERSDLRPEYNGGPVASNGMF
jgi:V-type H+-transporting ATPase subunit e